jgi:hypothetical protein
MLFFLSAGPVLLAPVAGSNALIRAVGNEAGAEGQPNKKGGPKTALFEIDFPEA